MITETKETKRRSIEMKCSVYIILRFECLIVKRHSHVNEYLRSDNYDKRINFDPVPLFATVSFLARIIDTFPVDGLHNIT